jgi:hypothetical protein
MKKTITQTYCDICKKETPITTITYPVFFTTDQTEGRPCKPYISNENIDMCEECKRAALMIEAIGAQGVNEYSILRKKENDE